MSSIDTNLLVVIVSGTWMVAFLLGLWSGYDIAKKGDRFGFVTLLGCLLAAATTIAFLVHVGAGFVAGVA